MLRKLRIFIESAHLHDWGDLECIVTAPVTFAFYWANKKSQTSDTLGEIA